ncbi:hypothetical protein BN8_01764 [Fibrisoma limi BUZ 3]|uniref:DUF4126 domain-containing protein n=1 Tax=Fibrisoma limi BUZ 3 TaxID=1185876 RepID=I2GFR7_9BACT|nr:hypothetical protein [Fibrisoma limi]CCH52742.1 hypothetical protein BN8_01764 [Fibrisoma limi BUZ 3]
MINTYFRAFSLGVVAGMRSMMAPALLSRKLVRTIPTKQPSKPIHYLALPTTSMVLTTLAGSEIIGDKVPSTPNRTAPPVFGARVVSGATCGAFLSQVEGGEVAAGAAAGGLGAAVGTVAFFQLRMWLTRGLGIPDPVVALAEDALAISLGWQVVNSIEPDVQTA